MFSKLCQPVFQLRIRNFDHFYGRNMINKIFVRNFLVILGYIWLVKLKNPIILELCHPFCVFSGIFVFFYGRNFKYSIFVRKSPQKLRFHFVIHKGNSTDTPPLNLFLLITLNKCINLVCSHLPLKFF
jgi:hypothetical protein